MSAISLPHARARESVVRRILERECLIVVACAVAAATVALVLPKSLSQDTWLALVDGRWIAQHGLPHSDAMAVMTRGASWIDQQWLAQLSLYELMRLGGMPLVLFASFLLGFAGLGVCAAYARRAGASPRSTACGLLAALLAAPWMMESRTQSFGVPLVALVYVLLATDSRRATRLVWLVLPLVALWANLHGTALLGSAVVCIAAALAWRRSPLRSTLLAAGSIAALFATPYGLSTPAYYERMLVGSPLHKYVAEWQPLQLRPTTAGLMFLTFAVVAGVARGWRRLASFERAALLLLVLGSLLAVRNGIWLALAVAASGPTLLDVVWPAAASGDDGQRTFNRRLAATAAAVGAFLVLVGFAYAPTVIAASWPTSAPAAIAKAAGAHGLVFGDDRHTDWLLWQEPQLTGRVAYDIRFELLSMAQFASLQVPEVYGRPTPVSRGYRVLLFPTRAAAKPFLRSGARVVYTAPGLVAVAR